MTELLDSGFVDSFRKLYPDAEGIYSWWSYRFKAREKNAGWRIDYFLVSEDAGEKITGAKIYTDVFGSVPGRDRFRSPASAPQFRHPAASGSDPPPH